MKRRPCYLHNYLLYGYILTYYIWPDGSWVLETSAYTYVWSLNFLPSFYRRSSFRRGLYWVGSLCHSFTWSFLPSFRPKDQQLKSTNSLFKNVDNQLDKDILIYIGFSHVNCLSRDLGANLATNQSTSRHFKYIVQKF